MLRILYYTLGNLDPKLRSCLKSIHLLSVAKYSVICTYGIEELLGSVVQDVLKLEQVCIFCVGIGKSSLVHMPSE